MQSMASGNQLDLQREERWPNKTPQAAPGESAVGTGVKVEFNEWDEEYDSDDFPMYAPQTSNVVASNKEAQSDGPKLWP